MPPVDDSRGPASLTLATVHGLKWTYASTIVTVVLQVGVTAALARLITPSAFGLVAMAGVFLRFGQFFAQLGVGQAVVQKQDLRPADVRAAFTSSLLLGFVFFTLFLVLAPLVGVLFPQTEGIVPVARVMSLSFAFSGLTSTTQGLLQRRFAFRAVALTEIGAYVVGYALIGLALAIAGLGVWSLVAASLATGVVTAVAFSLLCRRDIGFGLNVESLRDIYSFGWRMSLIGFVESLGSNLDTVWAGHYLGSLATGLYSRATNIANVWLYYFTVSLSRVLLPGLSRIQSERERLAGVYLASISVVAAIVMPVAWGLAGSARELILTLLGPQWSAAIPVLAVLALAVPFSLLTHFGAVVCDATASLNVRIAITAARVVWLALLLTALAPRGIVAVAVAYAVSELIAHAAYLVTMRRLLALPIVQLRRAYSVGVVCGALTGVLLFAVHAGLGSLGWPAPAVLSVQVVTGVVLLIGTVTKARGGSVWRQIRPRLTDAGYGREGASGAVAWVLRRMDGLADGAASKSAT